MKKFLSLALAVLMLLPLIVGCTPTPAPETDAPETDAPETDAPETDAPETDAPETDAPETDAPETDAPETDAPETDAPETDAPETDAPETDAPETDAPETDVPETDSLALELAADSPIGEYDIVEFVPEDKNDPDCKTGFVMQAVKLKYKNDDIVIVHLTNATETDYSVRLTLKYLDKDGKSITGVRETIPDVGAGWDNYYIYDPDFKFESFDCSLSISNPAADSVTGSIRSTAPVSFFTASSGLNWTDPTSLRSEYLAKEYTAIYARFPYENTSSERLHIVADYMLFDEDGSITHYDTMRIPTVAEAGAGEAIIPLKLTATPWDGDADLPEDYSGELTGIVAYRSVLGDTAAEANRVKSTTADFGYYTFEAQNGVILPYRLYLPSDYDETKEYPLLAIFHANGSQGKDNEKQMGDVAKFFGTEESPVFDCIIFAPQCPEGGWWLGENTDAAVELMDFLNDTFSTDKSRQYVTGFSMGGCATWNIVTRYPEKVSAAVPCAYAGGTADISEIDNPVYTDILIIHEDGSEEWFALPEETLDIPIYFVFGSSDETIPPEQCRLLVEAFESVDAQNFYYKEFGGVDHGNMGATYISKYNGYEHLYWLLEQRRETE